MTEPSASQGISLYLSLSHIYIHIQYISTHTIAFCNYLELSFFLSVWCRVESRVVSTQVESFNYPGQGRYSGHQANGKGRKAGKSRKFAFGFRMAEEANVSQKNCNEKNFKNRQEKLKTRATQDQKTINNKAKDCRRAQRDERGGVGPAHTSSESAMKTFQQLCDSGRQPDRRGVCKDNKQQFCALLFRFLSQNCVAPPTSVAATTSWQRRASIELAPPLPAFSHFAVADSRRKQLRNKITF